MKKIIINLVTLLLVLTTGCTMLAHQHNKNYTYGDIAIRNKSTNPQLFTAYAKGDFVGMGVNLNALEVVFYDWKTIGTQLLGTAADVSVLWAIKEGVDSLNNGSDDTYNSSGRDSLEININGNGNVTDVDVGNSNIETGI